MTKNIPRFSEGDRASLRAFEDHACWVWMVYSNYQTLYGSEETRDVLKNSAHQFFVELQDVFIHYILLQMCALTDPPHSMVRGQKIENLTINNLAATIPWGAPTIGFIEPRVARLNQIVVPIRDARNKIIAHPDKTTALTDAALGAFPAGDDAEFFEVLAEVVNTLHEAIFDEPFDIKVAAPPAGDLIVRLRLSLLEGHGVVT